MHSDNYIWYDKFMSTRRVEEVSAQLKREISMLIHETLAEKYGMVTLTDLDVAPNFKNAKAYISVFDDQYNDEVLKVLEAESRNYQRILGRKLRMKFTPRITFTLDSMQENIDKVDGLLKEIDHGS